MLAGNVGLGASMYCSCIAEPSVEKPTLPRSSLSMTGCTGPTTCGAYVARHPAPRGLALRRGSRREPLQHRVLHRRRRRRASCDARVAAGPRFVPEGARSKYPPSRRPPQGVLAARDQGGAAGSCRVIYYVEPRVLSDYEHSRSNCSLHAHYLYFAVTRSAPLSIATSLLFTLAR